MKPDISIPEHISYIYYGKLKICEVPMRDWPNAEIRKAITNYNFAGTFIKSAGRIRAAGR